MNKDKTVLFNSYLTLSGFDNARKLTITQNDKTKLEFILKDKNNEAIILDEQQGQAQIVDSDDNKLKAVFPVTVEGSTASFVIDKPLPVDEYELYIKVGDYYFPSTTNSFMLDIIESYDVVDVDTEDIQTIDLVVDALAEHITPLLSTQAEQIFRGMVEDDPDRFKGEKGDKLTIHDLTEEEFNSLKGADGEPFVFENFTPEQLENLKLKISESTVNENNETIVTFNDGSTLTIPRGAQGEKGEDGQSITFDDLTDEQKAELSGKDGLSAYQVAVDNGFIGSEYEWLESLKGQNGSDGTDGQSFDYESLTPEQKAEIKGEKGDKGDQLTWADLTQVQIDELRGNDGNDGKSAYELAVQEGFLGTLEEYLESLHGQDGQDGKSMTWEDLTITQREMLTGKDGDTMNISTITNEIGEEIGYNILIHNSDGETVNTGTIYHGKSFDYESLTEDQILDMRNDIISSTKDDDGNTVITFKDGSIITVNKGDRGDSGVDGLHGNTTSVENNEDGSYDIVVTNPNSETEISRTTVRDGVDGINGTDGIDGKSLRYEDLTPEQITELQAGLPVRPPKIYTREEYDALDSYDPHTLYFVVEEDEIPQ